MPVEIVNIVAEPGLLIMWHIGSQSTGFEEVHGGQAIGKRNTEGERVLEFAFANKLVVRNT